MVKFFEIPATKVLRMKFPTCRYRVFKKYVFMVIRSFFSSEFRKNFSLFEASIQRLKSNQGIENRYFNCIIGKAEKMKNENRYSKYINYDLDF